MTKFKRLLVYANAIFAVILFGCNDKNDNNNNNDEISVKLNQEQADVKDFFDNWDYVVLQTSNGTDDGFIGSIKYIAIDDSTIVIQSEESDDILVYDINGQLVSKFNRRGQGPHEYIDVSHIKLKDGKIWINSGSSRKLIQYDKNGEYLRHYNLPDRFNDFSFIDDETVILDSDNTNGMDYNIVVYNLTEGTIIAKMLPFDRKLGMGRGTLSSPFISNGTDKIYITQIFDNNIYELTSATNLKVAYKYDFDSKFKVSDEDLKEKSKLELYKMTAGQNYVRWFGPGYWTGDISYQYLDCYPKYIYKHDWSTGKGSLISIGEKINPDFPFLQSRILTVYDGNYVSTLATDNINYIEDKIGKKIITDSVEISDDSNPVLFFHHYKQ